MKMEVALGQTKAPGGVVLEPLLMGDAKAERVFFLMHSEGKVADIDALRDECASVLQHVILEGEGDAYTRLESALKELNGLLKGFLLNSDVKDVHLMVGVLEESGALHLSHIGRAEAYLIRGGSASQITEYHRGKPPTAFLHIVSGQLEERDHLMVSTQRLLRTVTPAQMVQITARGADVLTTVVSELESSKEAACLMHITAPADRMTLAGKADQAVARAAVSPRQRQRASAANGFAAKLTGVLSDSFERIGGRDKVVGALKSAHERTQEILTTFRSDLKNPERKRRAHLLLLASAAGVFVAVWMVIQLSVLSQRSQSKGDLANLVSQINSDLALADTRKLTGDTDSANAILQRAEDRARQVMSNENGSFRSEALQLIDRIRSKREELNNVVRVLPRTLANLSAKKADITAQGFISVADGEFVVYDHQDYYRVFLNSIDGPNQLNTEELILAADNFSRFQTRVFLTTRNSLIEMANGQSTTMKTEDPKGWMTGSAIKTYLRYLYVLSPEHKQIYKYERLADRYGPPAEYNVSGDLTGAMDMTITGPVYVLRDSSQGGSGKEQREVVKLLRGEKQAFTIRNLPSGALDGVTKIFKSSAKGNFYFLDPVNRRIVVTTNDGDLGDSLYLKQYILDSEQVGKLVDMYVDPEDMRLYLLDEKKVYVVELQGNH